MELYPSVIADECLGAYIHKPELMVSSKYPIRKEDFVIKFHQIVFVTIYNLYTNGCQNITLLDINEWLKPYEAQYNIYKDNKGDEYISTILEITDVENFDYYYTQLRKFSCLRDYKDKGYDVNKFYDITKSEESQLEILNKYTIQDIIAHFDTIQLDIRQEYLGASSEIEENKAGDGLDDFLEQLEEKPLYGVSYLSDNLNAVTRGMIDGQLSCFSSPSGEGKAQPVNTIIPTPKGYVRLGDIKVGDYVYDRYGKPTKVLGVYPQGIMDEYKIILEDGRNTICNNNHLWSIFEKNNILKTVDTNEIIKLLNNNIKINIPNFKSFNLSNLNNDKIAITKVEKLNTKSEMVCIYVDNDEHLYLTNDYIVTHNTSLCAGVMARLCATKVWDNKTNTFVLNPYKTRNGGLYIQFELDNISELSLKFLGYITNIPVNTILDGKLTAEQKDRLLVGKEILKESNIHMVYAPNFTKQSIDDSVKSHIIKYGIDLFIMDYIQDVSSLNAEMVKANGGVGLRTDQVLAGLSAFLKEVARKYNIPVYTCTQTNANLGTNEVIGVESIAGSRAVANKLDVGGVFLSLRPKEEKVLQEIEAQLHERGFNKCHPTHIYHMYKTRFGSYPQNIKIWVNFDKGTCRMKDCFCTDWKNKLIAVKPISLIRNDENKIIDNTTNNNIDDIF